MAVITISRQFGSGGDEIAYRLSQALKYRYFNKHMIREAAKASGLSEITLSDDILDYTEENHQVRNFLNALFESMPVIPYAGVWSDDVAAQFALEDLRKQRIQSLRLVQLAVRWACQVDNMVIVGRGGQALLKDQPNAHHIRIIAPLEVRSSRIQEQLRQNHPKYSQDEAHQTEVRAKELMTQRDAASADYIKCFYHVHWDDPLLYHLIINTGKVSLDQAAQMIIRLVQA